MRPSPPDLDGERWFKSVLATLLRGAVEDSGGTVQVWEERVHREVLFHPAGRFPAEKVLIGSQFRPPLPLVEGEQALLERFDVLATPKQRWRWMFWEEELGQAARLMDPVELGESYSPQRWIGAGFDWDGVAGAGVEFGACRQRLRSEGIRWVIFTDTSLHPVCQEWSASLKEELGESALLLHWDENAVHLPDFLTQINDWIQAPSDRFVCLGIGRGVPLLLRTLAEDPALRDRVYAVVSIGGALRGTGEHELWGSASFNSWLEHHYDYVSLDTEMARETPYFSIGLSDMEHPNLGFAGLGLDEMIFPELPAERAPVEGVSPISLGCLPMQSDERHLAVRALWIFVTCWIRARVIP